MKEIRLYAANAGQNLFQFANGATSPRASANARRTNLKLKRTPKKNQTLTGMPLVNDTQLL